jgi:hypothetical protein
VKGKNGRELSNWICAEITQEREALEENHGWFWTRLDRAYLPKLPCVECEPSEPCHGGLQSHAGARSSQIAGQWSIGLDWIGLS